MAALRVMTWNLWWRFGPDWRGRQPAIRRTLQETDADVVALQEVWGTDRTTQAHELGRALDRHAAFAAPSLPPPPDVPEHPDQAGVAVGLGLLSRWPVREVRTPALPDDGGRPPVTLVARVDHPDGPLHVLVACLAYPPATQRHRIRQARALAALAADPALDGPLPVVVAGDLNAAPGSPVLEPLLAVLTDAWTAGGGDPDAGTLPADHPQAPVEVTELIGRRIDHVLVRAGRPGGAVRVECAVLAGEPVDGVHPSDHRAVVCDVALPFVALPYSASVRTQS